MYEECIWHRAIVPVGNPTSIFAAATFHYRVRDGVEVGPLRQKHQKRVGDKHPQDCIEEKEEGQALGLLVHLSFKHCCSST